MFTRNCSGPSSRISFAAEPAEDDSDEEEAASAESSVTARVLPMVGADRLAGTAARSVSLGLTVRGQF